MLLQETITEQTERIITLFDGEYYFIERNNKFFLFEILEDGSFFSFLQVVAKNIYTINTLNFLKKKKHIKLHKA